MTTFRVAVNQLRTDAAGEREESSDTKVGAALVVP
jgi:hypothetical protein